jgi:hypothetical protein
MLPKLKGTTMVIHIIILWIYNPVLNGDKLKGLGSRDAHF